MFTFLPYKTNPPPHQIININKELLPLVISELTEFCLDQKPQCHGLTSSVIVRMLSCSTT